LSGTDYTLTTCPASTDTATCIASVTSPATASKMPKMASCYVSSNLAASGLAGQSKAACLATHTFCMVIEKRLKTTKTKQILFNIFAN